MLAIKQICCAIGRAGDGEGCYLKAEKKPIIPLLSMPSEQVKQEMDDLGIKLMYPCLLDYFQDYYYTTTEGWGLVRDYIYVDFPMPDYIAARMDCEDFGILLKGLISTLFGLNYQALVVGDSKFGSHGYNMMRNETGLFLLEPQTADFLELGQDNYYPKYALL